MAGSPDPDRAHRPAAVAAEAGAPVRRLRRLLRHLGKPAGGAGGAGADPLRRRGQSRGNGRADRRRAVRPAERARPRNRGAVPAHGRALQGARRLARVHRGGGIPSGGNKFRGLYNIVLKSIGAARKRDPDVRLDHAIDYAEPMREPGYYFMDSPGNDLESIAGQVAAGSNMIFFVTGNGSITNFPFVPTIKIVTTSQRFRLLAEDMDVDAGAYQEGISMEELAAGLFARTREVASGKRSRGEQAGHSQVSIWRNWPQRDKSNLETLLAAPVPSGEAHPIAAETAPGYPLQGGRRQGGNHLHRPRRAGAAHQSLRRPDSPPDRGAAQRPRRRRRKGDHAVRQPRAYRRVRRHRLRHRGNLRPHPRRLPLPPAGQPRTADGARVRKDAQRLLPGTAEENGPLRSGVRLGQRADGRRHRVGDEPRRVVVLRPDRDNGRAPATPRWDWKACAWE